MTNLNPDTADRDDSGLGWVTLAEGVDISRAWLSTQTPQLFAAWQQTQNAQQRLQIAQQIQQIAATTDSDREQEPGEDPADPRDEHVNVRIQWAETTRYEADFYLSPYSSEGELWSEIGMVPDALRRTLEVTDNDNAIVSIIDLDGDGMASVLERSISAGNTVSGDWGDLADSIDERLAEGPDWPALACALDRADAAGYDVAGNLARLAQQDALPERHPAQELQYRLMADCDAVLVSADDADAWAASGETATGQGSRPPDLSPPAIPPGDGPPR